jgi:hypothetical protein
MAALSTIRAEFWREVLYMIRKSPIAIYSCVTPLRESLRRLLGRVCDLSTTCKMYCEQDYFLYRE